LNKNPDAQDLPLRQLAEQRGWSVARAYSDRASGAKENPQGLKALLAGSRRGAFEVVLVWRFDRFARSIEQLVSALAEFGSLKIDFVSHQECLDDEFVRKRGRRERGMGRIWRLCWSYTARRRSPLRPLLTCWKAILTLLLLFLMIFLLLEQAE
jgi:hypothetical protein